MSDDRPGYDIGPQNMLIQRAHRAAGFARQILDTVRPYLSIPHAQLTVLDVGCGYGHTTVELARLCRHVVGIDVSQTFIDYALTIKQQSGLANLEFDKCDIEDIQLSSGFDLIILDNVLEHLPNQQAALRQVSLCLKPKGVVFILVPNCLWPIEVHYHLPFLSYLPLRLANIYLRLTGRGIDYSDASYAPTLPGLNRLLRNCDKMTFSYTLPAHLSLATMGQSLHYRVGVAVLRHCPWLWCISKMFLVVGVKQ